MYNSQEASTDPSGENSNSNASNGSTNTVIYNPHQNGMISSQLSPMHTWNPVLERLTGMISKLFYKWKIILSWMFRFNIFQKNCIKKCCQRLFFICDLNL